MKLFNFKAESSLFIVKLLILAAAVPFLWLTDLLAFLCDLKKVKKGAKWFTKGAGITILVIASLHICENMLSELSELYVELIRIVWLGFQLIQFSSISLWASSCIICGIFIIIGVNEKFKKHNTLSSYSFKTKYANYPSCSNLILPDGSFFKCMMHNVYKYFTKASALSYALYQFDYRM